MRPTIFLAAILLLTACRQPPDVAFAPGTAPPDEPVAWTHLALVDGVLDGGGAAAALTGDAMLRNAWRRYGFEGEPGPVDFEHEVVLLLAQADDACPDELVRLEVVAEHLEAEWLEPPGGCDQPLIMRLHAVRVHRGHLRERFDVSLPAPFDTELQTVTIELPPYDGQAPPPPSPPRALTAAELDEVFAGHPVRRCRPDDELVRSGTVDGPLSADAEVAGYQQRRADFGLPSDEESVRKVMAAADRDDEYGFPMLPEERRLDEDVTALAGRAGEWLRSQGFDTEREVTPLIDRSSGIAAAVVVWEGEAERVQGLLDDEFGPGAVTVRPTPYAPDAVAKAHEDLGRAALPASGAGSVTYSSGFPGPVRVGMIDPTRAALDALAAAADPGLLCVDPVLSGVRPGPAAQDG